MRNWLKYTLIILGVLISVGYAGFSFLKGKELNDDKICKGVDVVVHDSNDQVLIKKNDIIELLNKDKLVPTGRFYRDFKTKKIEDAVKKYPMVLSADVYKTPNGKLRINIEQRSPVFQIIGNGGNYFVDKERKVIPVMKNYAVYVPVVSGNITRKFAKGSLFDFIQYISADNFWNDQIEQIYVADSNKVLLIPRVGDQTIIMGNLDRYKNKLDKLKKLYLYGLNKVGWKKYKTIDLQYKNQVVCTK